jgi:hypothetical protein
LTSDFEEYFFVIKKTEKNPFQQDACNCQCYGIVRIANQVAHPLKNPFVGIRPADYFARHVNEDGVHANDPEKECPSLVTLYVYDPIKQRHKQEAKT